MGFQEMFRRELRDLGVENVETDVVTHATSGKESVVFAEANLCGLALSGGGIRSATFNLGVLQALVETKLLQGIHYISAVSGGAYIAGWLEAHLRRGPAERVFDIKDGPLSESVDNVAVRHLREFSRFLLPRIGFTESESWLFLFRALTAAVPTLLLAMALIAFGYGGWLLVAMASAARPDVAVITFAVLTLVLLSCGKATKAQFLGKTQKVKWALAVHTILVAAVATALYVGVRDRIADWVVEGWHWGPPTVRLHTFDWQHLLVRPDYRWHYLATCLQAPAAWFGTGLAWGASLAFSSILLRKQTEDPKQRFWESLLRPNRLRLEKDSITSKLLFVACVWLALTGVWLLTHELVAAPFGKLSLTAIVPGYFALLGWAIARTKDSPSKIVLGRARDILQHATPQVLVYVLCFLGVAGIAAVEHRLIDRFDPYLVLPLVPTVAAGTIFLIAFGVEPHVISLHEWYRGRIARAFLSDPEQVAATDGLHRTVEQPSDDWKLVVDQSQKPLLLVCCAANDQRGDRLKDLGRGAESATLSSLGLYTANEWSTLPLKNHRAITLADALAASGAAFNSAMGAMSVRLGPVVSFLMSAFNLRLGLWVRRRLPRSGEWAGWQVVAEMLALTSLAPKAPVHLSDGGHFENTGIYELVRRHCRYIIASDCGQDEGSNHDDIGNAIRKVRQDFGVDIELELRDCGPDADGVAPQPITVGTIHYGPADKGILIVIKPLLTADAPPDVRQYANRNRHFPNETTGDQFYDDAQWEAYRRLGKHIGMSMVAKTAQLHGDVGGRPTTENTIQMMSRVWAPVPADMQENFLTLTERVYRFEADCMRLAPRWLHAQIYSDLVTTDSRIAEQLCQAEARDVDGMMRAVSVIVSLLQLMEDVWHGARLEEAVHHPLAAGWMSYFHRWTRTKAVRDAWPLLSPMYSLGFRRFATDHFDLPPIALLIRVREFPVDTLEHSSLRRELEATLTRYQSEELRDGVRTRLFVGEVTLAHGVVEVAACALRQRERDTGFVVEWDARDCVVPPYLRGAECGSAFVEALVLHLEADPRLAELRVNIPSSRAARAPGNDSEWLADASQLHLVQLYRARGFGPVRDERRDRLLMARRRRHLPDAAPVPLASSPPAEELVLELVDGSAPETALDSRPNEADASPPATTEDSQPTAGDRSSRRVEPESFSRRPDPKASDVG